MKETDVLVSEYEWEVVGSEDDGEDVDCGWMGWITRRTGSCSRQRSPQWPGYRSWSSLLNSEILLFIIRELVSTKPPLGFLHTCSTISLFFLPVP